MYVEYGVPVWDPRSLEYIDTLETVQTKFATKVSVKSYMEKPCSIVYQEQTQNKLRLETFRRGHTSKSSGQSH